MEIIEVGELIKTVRKLANDNPENSYSGYKNEHGLNQCSYFKGVCSNGSVGCIFGQALEQLYDLNKMPKTLCMLNNNDSIHMILEALETGSETEQQWCQSVQNAQDQKMYWKTAIEQADFSYHD